MSIKVVGDTVLMDGHWWIAAATTVDGFLMVNLTTIRKDFVHDDACVFKGGCTSFIPNDSYVFYYHACAKTVAEIEAQLAKLDCVVVNKIPLILQIRILTGFSKSRYANRRHKELAAQYLRDRHQLTNPSQISPA